MWYLIDPEEIAKPEHALVAEKAMRAHREQVVEPLRADSAYRHFTVPSWNDADTDYRVVIRFTGRGWEVSCPCFAKRHCWHGYAAALKLAALLRVDVPQPAPQPAQRPRGARPQQGRRGRVSRFEVYQGGRSA